MTARTLLAVLWLVVATAWAGTALANDMATAYDAENGTASASYSDGEWSGEWIGGKWTPGYWANGVWNQAEWSAETGDWTATVDGQDFVIATSDWDAMPQTATAPRSLSEVDNARAEEGRVMGYTSESRSQADYMEGEAKAEAHYHDGEKCYTDHGSKGYGGHGCDSCGHNRCGCDCPGKHYDCWGVWQTDDWDDFTSIRESDYDPVMGRGDRGRGWFW